MVFLVYILYSASFDQYYVGHSQNIRDRIFRHNNSGSKATKKANDWKLVYSETFDTKKAAAKRETAIKKKKSRNYIEWLLNSAGKSVPKAFGKVTGSTP
ncbi:GIY-YIG nuclease family protein [Terrimonas pollutisoli]|uniref:GIY-YIG nuclease family protein n=1 Tax=Terrimonas pollutisoli TaxID=3034147 RepID=UPI0034E01598